jgi:hypothetical protein
MLPLPQVAEPLLMGLRLAFTEPTFNRFLPLLVGAIVLRGRRTVTSILWAMRGLVPGHMTDYHRVFSRAAWVLWPLARVLATFAIALTEEHGGGWLDCRGRRRHRGPSQGQAGLRQGSNHDSGERAAGPWARRWGEARVVRRGAAVSGARRRAGDDAGHRPDRDPPESVARDGRRDAAPSARV